MNALGPTWPVKTASAPNRAMVWARLNASALGGVEVLGVVVSGGIAGIRINQHKMLGATESWIDLTLQTRLFRSNDDFHRRALGFFFGVLSYFFRFQRFLGVDLFLKGPVDEKSTLATANNIAVVLCTAAVSVVSAVIDQETEIASTTWKRVIGNPRRRIALIVAIIGIIAAVVEKNTKSGPGLRCLRSSRRLLHSGRFRQSRKGTRSSNPMKSLSP